MARLTGLFKTGWALLSGSRQTLLLLAIAGAAAALYAWGASAAARHDRLLAWAERACLSAGARYSEAGKGEDGCARRILDLAAYERQAQAATNAALAAAEQRRAAQSAADIALAETQAAHRRAAAEQMEKADAAIAPDNRVGPDWFAGVNRLAGLRPSGG